MLIYFLGERAIYQTVNRVAKEEGVSESLVRRSFTEETKCQMGVDEESPKASRAMGLDEFSVKKRILDTTILPESEVVEVVAMDMYEPF